MDNHYTASNNSSALFFENKKCANFNKYYIKLLVLKYSNRQWFIEKVLKPLGRGHGFPRSLKSHHRVLSEQELGDLYEPCVKSYILFLLCWQDNNKQIMFYYLTTYLNRQDVQTALHAKSGTVWSMCSNNVVWNETDLYMEPVYQFLINGGYNLHITVYSGDDDSVCGTLGTQSWLWNLGYSPVGNWVSWTQNEEDNGPQVAGFFIRFNYNNKVALNFVTVHSAGHQVPWFNAQRGYLVLDGYLDVNNLASSFDQSVSTSTYVFFYCCYNYKFKIWHILQNKKHN
ncbi:hypothetical protein RFI_00126 [Reticulomyxa filosa]|uniref:Uncharacterized protein n=1 Tax=Reticulomyxa filosa TaxID=46433 RepID=X6PFG2_RETFI|nr:hypothetical protein RFI_00126 [Reticulomyxa filosa]|eukprot:ETO36936.1 hypothetical protein RFI_00126 [Reticulomyxa filosa]